MVEMSFEPGELLDQIPMELTHADSDGVIRCRNRAAVQRPSPRPGDIGSNIRDCHAQTESLKKIDLIFADFLTGRKTPHHYVSDRMGIKELVTLIPTCGNEQFSGCLTVVHALALNVKNRSF